MMKINQMKLVQCRLNKLKMVLISNGNMLQMQRKKKDVNNNMN